MYKRYFKQKDSSQLKLGIIRDFLVAVNYIYSSVPEKDSIKIVVKCCTLLSYIIISIKKVFCSIFFKIIIKL